MATDVDVQYFSHLNGLTLGNNWGDLIRLLDTCLVNGLNLPSITSASVDAQGDITLNFYAAHKCMLFQIIELTGFTPSELNGKYRIKGIPSANQLILKATHAGKSVGVAGNVKLASLGYEIIYRDAGDVKRVYRAKNPTVQHPFIRVDESVASPDGTSGVYPASYAKSAMVGLIENMSHIDDFEDTSKLQLPLDTADLKKNWKITGTGSGVVRGWSKWYWASNYNNAREDGVPTSGNRGFNLAGDKDAFYLLNSQDVSYNNCKRLNACGLFNTALANDVVPNWFLMSTMNPNGANSSVVNYLATAYSPLCYQASTAKFSIPQYNVASRIINSTFANPILPNYQTGYSNPYGSSTIPALEVPFSDDNAFLRGSLKHVAFSGKNIRSYVLTTLLIGDVSMYVADSIMCNGNTDTGAIYFYLGELE